MADQIEIEILASVQQALKSVQTIEDTVVKSSKKMEGALNIAAGAAAAFVAVFSTSKLISFFNDVTKAASEQDDAINSLNSTLAITGQYSEKSSKALQDYADSLSQTTKYSSDAILAAEAHIQVLARLDSEGLKKATAASLDLASGLGIDLATAQNIVGKAAEGNIDILKRYGVRVNEGITKAETFANTLKALNTQFGGRAAADLNTYSGAIAFTSNAFDEVLASIGQIITRSPAVQTAIKAIGSAFLQIKEYIEKNRDGIASFIKDGVIKLIGVLPTLIRGIDYVSEAFYRMQQAAGFVKKATAVVTGAIATIVVQSGGGNPGSILNAVKKEINAIDSETDVAKKAAEERSKFFNEAANQAEFLVKKTTDQIKTQDALTKTTVTSAKNQKIALQELTDEQKKAQENFANLVKSNPAQAIQNVVAPKPGAAAPEGLTGVQKGVAVAGAGVEILMKGAEGAVKAMAQGLTLVLTPLLGPLAGVAGQVFEIFAQGPEKVKAMVSSFIQAIPTILTNVIASIPALIETLISALPTLVEQLIFAIVEKIPDIIIGFIENLPTLFENLGTGLTTLLDTLIERAPEIIGGIVAALPELVSAIQIQLPLIAARFATELAVRAPFIAVQFAIAFVQQVPTIVAEIAKGVRDAIANAVKGVGSAVGGVASSGGGIVKSVGKLFGFAEGGVIPSGFPNDTFPAALTSGEAVISNDLTGRLDSFLRRSEGSGGASGNMTVILQVGESQLAQVLLNLNQRGFRTA